MKSFIYFLLFVSIVKTNAQDPIVEIAISRDTVLLGNAFYIQYTFDSKYGQFIAPEIKGANIIGQNFVSNTSIINGEVKAFHKQTYLVQPLKIGVLRIPATVIKSKDSSVGDIVVPQIDIIVNVNPQNLEVDPQEDAEWKMIDLLKGKVIKRKSKKL